MKIRRRLLSTLVGLVVAAVVAVLLPVGSASAATTPADGVTIRLAQDNLCLNVAGGSLADKAKIIQYACSTSPTALNDKFKLVPRGGDTFWIQGIQSGKCLNVSGGSLANSAPIIQYTCSDSPNTRWLVQADNQGPTDRFVSVNSGKCINLPNGSPVSGVQLIQYPCAQSGGPNEKFYMPPAASGTPLNLTGSTNTPITVLQGTANGPHGVPPIYYGYVDGGNLGTIFTDLNPFPAPNDSPQTTTTRFGSNLTIGRIGLGVLADGRVQMAAHDSSGGDVLVGDEGSAGTGTMPNYYDISGGFPGQPAIGQVNSSSTGDKDFTLDQFAIVNGSLWYVPELKNNPQMPQGAWRDLGGTTDLVGTPVITQVENGARITALTKSGTAKTATLVGKTLSDWVDLGGDGLVGTPSVVTRPGYLATIFAKSADGTVVTKKQKGDGTWPAGWSSIPGLKVMVESSASAVLDRTGRMAVTARGEDKLVYVAYETGADTGEFGDWTAVTTTRMSVASDPTAFAFSTVVGNGPSFGVAFKIDNGEVPMVYYFNGSSSTAGKAKANAVLHKLAMPKTANTSRAH